MKLEKRIKIAILYENWGEEETAPPPEPEKKRRAKTKRRKKKREKHDYEEIFEALEKVGHQPSYQTLDGTDKTLTALARCEGFARSVPAHESFDDQRHYHHIEHPHAKRNPTRKVWQFHTMARLHT